MTHLHPGVVFLPPGGWRGAIGASLIVLALLATVATTNASEATLEEGLGDFDRANRAFALERYEEARELYQKVLDDPTQAAYHDHAMLIMARCANNEGEWEQAEATLQQLMLTFPKSDLLDDAYFLMGRHFSAETPEKDPTLAMQHYRTVIERFPKGDKADRAEFMLGEIAVETERWDEALKAFTNLTQRKLPEKLDLDNRFSLAEVYRNPRNPRRDLKKSLLLYLDIAKRFPGRGHLAKTMFAMGACYRDLGQHSEAIKYFEKLIKEHPHSLYATVAQPLLARCYQDLQKQLVGQILAQVQNAEKPAAPASPEVLDFIETIKTRAQSIKITADEELEGGRYNGNVLLVKGEMRITCQELVLDKNSFHAMAKGHVRLVRGEALEIACGELSLNLREDVVDLRDQVRVVHEGNELFVGDATLFSLATHQVLVETAKSLP